MARRAPGVRRSTAARVTELCTDRDLRWWAAAVGTNVHAMASSSPRAAAGTDGQPLLRLRSPADVCEAVPYLVGFEPSASLVAISLRGPRQRAGLVTRVDLPDPEHALAVAELVVEHLRRDGADAALVVAYADAGDPSPDATVQAVLATCGARGIAVAEALLVTDGRWRSYVCRRACCPPAGTPVRDRLAEPSVCATTLTAEGRQVLPGRSALVASIAPVEGLLATAMGARLDVEVERFLRAAGGDRPRAYADTTVRLVRSWVVRLQRGDTLPVDDAARMIVGLADREARDRCLGGGMDDRGGGTEDPPLPDEALELWRELVRRAVRPGLVAPVATLLAACAYLDHGNGALANVALDRALADQPAYVLAGYLMAMLDGGIAPSTVRAWLDHPAASSRMPTDH